jgi:hypothetical protein
MKKLLAVPVALAIALGFAGCGEIEDPIIPTAWQGTWTIEDVFHRETQVTGNEWSYSPITVTLNLLANGRATITGFGEFLAGRPALAAIPAVAATPTLAGNPAYPATLAHVGATADFGPTITRGEIRNVTIGFPHGQTTPGVIRIGRIANAPTVAVPNPPLVAPFAFQAEWVYLMIDGYRVGVLVRHVSSTPALRVGTADGDHIAPRGFAISRGSLESLTDGLNGVVGTLGVMTGPNNNLPPAGNPIAGPVAPVMGTYQLQFTPTQGPLAWNDNWIGTNRPYETAADVDWTDWGSTAAGTRPAFIPAGQYRFVDVPNRIPGAGRRDPQPEHLRR